MTLTTIIIIIIVILLIAVAVLYQWKVENSLEIERLKENLDKSIRSNKKYLGKIQNLDIKFSVLKEDKGKCESEVKQLQKENSKYISELNELKKYTPIQDVEQELSSLKNIHDNEIKIEKQKIQLMKDEVNEKLLNAEAEAQKIKEAAVINAKEIAGSAYNAMEHAKEYEATAVAMKNIIKGYGQEYLFPHRILLDNLAEEYSHKEAGKVLSEQKTLIKQLIRLNQAVDCNYAEQYRKNTAMEFALDAYNGKVDTIMAKVKYDNYGKLLQQLEDAFTLVNYNGKAFRNTRITKKYHEAILEQLRLAVIVLELKREDLEEQRKIKEQMREEEKVKREYEKLLKDAKQEEKLLEKAMLVATQQLGFVSKEEKEKLELQLKDYEAQLLKVKEKAQRAISMAQITKIGHVYIISNIGSFGKNIFKIGMTRRLEPLDRVKELGDASVPFSFDVHAMIQSDDAPKLEKKLHKIFEEKQVNKVNNRKEFFDISLSEIKQVVEKEGYELHWTLKAEALEFYETKDIEKRLLEKISNI